MMPMLVISMMLMTTIVMMLLVTLMVINIAFARNILGTRNLSEILAEREDIGDHMHKVLTMMMMRRRMVMMMVTTYKRFLDRKFGFNCISKSVKVSQGQYLTDMVTLCFLTKMEFIKCFTLERFTTF